MKRSTVNAAYREALAVFARTGWTLPPNPRWDITDCGSGDFARCGIVLVNLAEEPEYCEKLIYLRAGQEIPLHTHRKKKEDIICRHGRMMMEVWPGLPAANRLGSPMQVKCSGAWITVEAGRAFALSAGGRITLVPGVYHRFWAAEADTVIGEVSTANDDLHDNIFADTSVARFTVIENDEPPAVRLVSDP
jgi:D-lyxose ketol-isomerase